MKKSFKKIAVTLISATLIMSMAAAMPTSAATTAGAQTKVTSQSVTMPQGTATYSIYQVAKATYNDAGKIYTYKVNAPFAGVLDVDAETGLLKRDTVLVHSMSASQTQALAKALDAAKSGDSTSADAGTSVDLEPGYYLIVGSSASVTAPMLISVDGEPIAPLTNKSSEITIDKTITAIDTAYGIDNVISGNGKTGIADKGAKVTYKLETQVPTYDRNVRTVTPVANMTPFQIIDLPEDVLKVVDGTIAVSVGGTTVTEGTDTFSITAPTATEISAFKNCEDTTVTDVSTSAFKVVFDNEYTLANGGKSVVVTFDATVGTGTDGKMDLNTDANDNTCVLSYSNNYNTAKGSVEEVPDPTNPGGGTTIEEHPDTPKTEHSKADVFCTVFTANKVDSEGRPLNGAGFSLYEGRTADASKLIKTITTGTTFTFEGLGNGTYTLSETQVPKGYKKAEDITFTISSEDTPVYAGNFKFEGGATAATIDVANYPGQLLPGTGGAGTILFTVGGATIVLLAGVLFVFYMKKRRIEE
jgi:fimbrial isopeptide formation D2 family protein/LPXTG-motif cell wall-anchored protein